MARVDPGLKYELLVAIPYTYQSRTFWLKNPGDLFRFIRSNILCVTKQDMANDTKLHIQSITRLERGTAEPTISTIRQALPSYGLSTDEYFNLLYFLEQLRYGQLRQRKTQL